jgi:hypothetical protein
MQTKKQSLIESLINILIGYFVSIGSQIVIFPQFGIEVSIKDNFCIGLYFTIVSIIRSYLVRRFFNKK